MIEAEEKTCPCRFCGAPTKMLDAEMCADCWEVWHRLNGKDISVVMAILVDVYSGEVVRLK